jgi:TatD DNase family protein
MALVDAHNHLQDERLRPHLAGVLAWYRDHDPVCAAVNGACESDWEDVAQLAETSPFVLPSFGYHPWYISEASGDWREHLITYLDRIPSGVGEIGLDRWKKGLDFEKQVPLFREQLSIAAERNLPASIHCLDAWGPMLDTLKSSPLPACGFLLHSYGGPREMIPAFPAISSRPEKSGSSTPSEPYRKIACCSRRTRRTSCSPRSSIGFCSKMPATTNDSIIPVISR